MRICPTCGDMVAATLRCCPRCAGPLPQPRAGYPGSPEYPRESGYTGGPGYLPAPYLAEPDYPAEPGYRAEPDYLPAPYLAEPGYQPEPGYRPEPGYQPERDGGYGPERGHGPRPYGPPWPGPAEDEDDPGPEVFGDRFAGGGPGTGGFPAWPAPEPGPAAAEDPASRLVYAPPGRRRRAPRHRARIAGAVLGTAALLAGVITAWAVFGQHRAGPGSRLAGRQTTATRPASPAVRAAPSASASAPVGASPSAAPSAPAPGDGAVVVAMAPGMSQAPDAAQVNGFLVSYFTAINTHDYEQYERLLVPSRRAELTAADFARGYGTTTDTAASIVGISPTADGVAATVSFTSEQRTAAGAAVTTCTLWDITLYLRKQGGALLIGSPPPAYHAYHRSCP